MMERQQNQVTQQQRQKTDADESVFWHYAISSTSNKLAGSINSVRLVKSNSKEN